MQATGQNNSHNIIIRRQQEPTVSMVITRIENPVMTLRLVLLLQSIAGQFYGNCTIVITQTIVQMIRLQSSLINIQTMCTFKIIREQCRYFLLIRSSIAVIVHYYQSNRIMERLS